jgi:carboxymethylenebutenolidase
MQGWSRLCIGIALLVASIAYAGTPPDTVAFRSGSKTLHGLLYKPMGTGPYPAVLYNHGGSPGLISNAAFDAVAPHFVEKGWVFFAPYRRGQGLSADAGTFVGAEIRAAEKHGGLVAGGATLVRLLSGEQLDDQLAALAWLQAQPFVQAKRIAVMGNSFGGIETVLGAEHHAYCAAVDLTGAAMSWDQAPALRERLTQAVQHAQSPILFLQAENDYSVEPSKVLYAAARAAHRVAQIHIYPPFQGGGVAGMQGHSFAWLGVSEWWPEAFGFVEEHCRSGPIN